VAVGGTGPCAAAAGTRGHPAPARGAGEPGPAAGPAAGRLPGQRAPRWEPTCAAPRGPSRDKVIRWGSVRADTCGGGVLNRYGQRPRKSERNSRSPVAWSAAFAGSGAGPCFLALIIPRAQCEPLQLQSLGHVSNSHQQSYLGKHSVCRAPVNKEGKEVFRRLQHGDLRWYRCLRPKSCSGSKLPGRRAGHVPVQMPQLCPRPGSPAPRARRWDSGDQAGGSKPCCSAEPWPAWKRGCGVRGFPSPSSRLLQRELAGVRSQNSKSLHSVVTSLMNAVCFGVWQVKIGC